MKVEFEAALHILFALVLPGSRAMFAGYENSERQTKSIARREPQHFREQTGRRFQLDHLTVDPKVESFLLQKVDTSESNTSDSAQQPGDAESSSTPWGQQPVMKPVSIGDYNTTAYCGEDYLLGEINGTDCGADHNIIIDQDACLDAAGVVNATAGTPSDPSKFYVHSDFYHKRPKGCFALPCNDDARVCFFYNGIGDTPSGEIYGRPVCSRQRWANGATVNGSPNPDSNPSGCAAGYSGILEITRCQQMLACRTECPGQLFTIDAKNHTLHDQFPQGCFINEADGCVYWNPPEADNLPSEPVGVPVCEVNSSNVLHFPEYGDMWG